MVQWSSTHAVRWQNLASVLTPVLILGGRREALCCSFSFFFLCKSSISSLPIHSLKHWTPARQDVRILFLPKINSTYITRNATVKDKLCKAWREWKGGRARLQRQLIRISLRCIILLLSRRWWCSEVKRGTAVKKKKKKDHQKRFVS